MAKARWIKFGSTEGKIVRWLATHPRQNIVSIQEGCGYKFHNTISKAIHNLEDKGIVAVLDTYKSEKGSMVNLWGLSSEGRKYCVVFSSDFGFNRNEIMNEFREEEEDIDLLLSTIEFLKDLGIEDAEEIQEKALESAFKAYGGDICIADIFSMLLGQFIRKTMTLSEEDNEKIRDYTMCMLENDSMKKTIEENPFLNELIKLFLKFVK